MTRDGLRLELLGGFGLRDGSRTVDLPGACQRLVAFVALNDHASRRTHVAGVLWPDATDERSRANLRSALWRLRRSGYRPVTATPTHIGLAAGVAVDVRQVATISHRLLDRAAPCGDQDLDHAPLVGELLPDWYEDWVIVERERLRQLCLHALEALSVRLVGIGHYGEAADAALASIRMEPLRESANRALIGVHVAEGNRSEALRHYRWYRALLRAELGLEPSDQMHEQVTALLRREDAQLTAG